MLLCLYIQIFTLPKDTLIYPAHDYKGFTVCNHLMSISSLPSKSWLLLTPHVFLNAG